METTTKTAAAAEQGSPNDPARAEVAAQGNDDRARPGTIRSHRRHRARRALAGASALVVLALGGLACGGDDDDGAAGDDDRTTTTQAPAAADGPATTDGPGTTEASATEPAEGEAAPGATEQGPASGPALDPGVSPISWRGIGQILYGDDLSSVQRVEGLEFTWDQQAFEGFGRVCFTATTPGLDLTFLVRSPDGNPLADPLDGVIDVVGGLDARTTSGLGAGNTVADIESLYGEADEVHDIPVNPGQQLMVWRREGGAYGFVVEAGTATQVWSGDVSPDDIEPCA